MADGVSVGNIVGVLLAPVRKRLLHDLCREEVKKDARNDALPKGVAVQVPHLCINAMELLHLLDLVVRRRCVSEDPHSKVVHVRKHSPAVLEGHLASWVQEPILVGRHAGVLGVGD